MAAHQTHERSEFHSPPSDTGRKKRTMPDRTTFQVHANVNSDWGDNALRVTITMYDEHGLVLASETWRRHVRNVQFDGMDWQAYSAVTDLCKMMGHIVAHREILHDEVDTPLF